MTTHEDTLAEIVRADPSRARVLDRLGLDYCCGGEERLDQACARLDLDPGDVVAQLRAAPVTADVHACDTLSTAALLTHLVEVHHGFLHGELPAVEQLAGKVEGVHGARHPELGEIHRLVVDLRADLEPHLLKEERVLFPAIAELLGGRTQFPFGSIENPIRMMALEHDRAGALLARMREVSGGYAVPPDACASYRSLYARLAEIEHDTHLHVFEENHLLFPRVLALGA